MNRTARILVRAVCAVGLAVADKVVRHARGLVDAFELGAI